MSLVSGSLWIEGEALTFCLNSLTSPKAPFPRDRARARLAGVFMTLFALTLFVSARTICRSFAFLVGVLIFGEPLLVTVRQQMATNNITLTK